MEIINKITKVDPKIYDWDNNLCIKKFAIMGCDSGGNHIYSANVVKIIDFADGNLIYFTVDFKDIDPDFKKKITIKTIKRALVSLVKHYIKNP